MRSVNKNTGCKVGSKGDVVGGVLLRNKNDIVQAFSEVMQLVLTFYNEDGNTPSPAQVRRYSIVWINALRKQYPKIYKLAPGVCYSIAHRTANK